MPLYAEVTHYWGKGIGNEIGCTCGLFRILS
jgi:hypothetical protein